MSPTTEAILASWSVDPKFAIGLIVSAILYLRGWRVLHRITPARFPAWRLGVFLSGLAALWVAIASPLDTFSGLLLSAHMVQHLMLMLVAPPLILLGAPVLPLLRGLPRKFAHDGVGPFLSWPALRRFGDLLMHPVVCWLAMAVSLCAWHVPAAFELALRSPAWHKVEHACFFGTSLLFWWHVVRPFPSRPHWPLWTAPLYLVAADLVNTALCAILAFSDKVLYPSYSTVPRLFGTTALSDQIAAGVIMWVPGSLVFLIPATVLAIRFLSPSQTLARSVRRIVRTVPYAPFDLLNLPVIGRFLLSGRRLMQAVLLLIAVAVIADGLFGPQVSATNLAGVLPWTYWRALTVVALLAAGNFFCMACPFMLLRELGKRLRLKPRTWPRALRSKWFAVGLLVLFFWAYEAFGLWDKPAWTAWIIVGYFIGAFLVDAFVRGAGFCKYVCPIGQFHFITSLISPLEVKVREPAVCTGCKTHDCLRGNEQRRGCETQLYLPRKAGNMDCTFCLDCVRACPHDNIGLQVVTPGADLLRDPRRSSLGRLSRRTDVAAMALVLVFAAFANAAAMVAPVSVWLGRLGSPVTAITLFFVGALVFAPAILRAAVPTRELFCRFSLALVPLGTAMWAGHFLFHLLAGYHTAVPVLQRAAGGLLGQPDWSRSGMGISADSLVVLQTLLLDAGLLLTLYVGWRIAREYAPGVQAAFRSLVLCACVALALYASGVWIFLQPMQMRGMIGGSM
jgi:cytochrome c oxidase assembly factor CtaG/ferredoxin